MSDTSEADKRQVKKPREEEISKKTREKMANLSNSEANHIGLIIPSVATSFGAMIGIEVTTMIDNTLLENELSETVHIFSVWTGDPPSKIGEQANVGIGVIDVEAKIKLTGEPIFVKAEQLSDHTKFSLSLPQTLNRSVEGLGEIKVEFKTPNIYYSMPERAPFDRKLLNFKIKFHQGHKRSVLDIRYPESLAVRTRVDNSSYHSLAYGESQDQLRKLTFFDENPVEVKWYWGISETKKLLQPSIPLGSAAVSSLTSAMTLLFHNAGLEDAASTLLAIALLVPFFQVLYERLYFSPSADIRRLSWTDLTSLFSFAVYFISFLAVFATLILNEKLYDVALILTSGSSIIALILYGSYLLLITLGTLQKYTCDCDKCEKTFYRRPNANFDPETRKTYCKGCYNNRCH